MCPQNDAEMLARVAYGIAVANANPRVKNIAAHVSGSCLYPCRCLTRCQPGQTTRMPSLVRLICFCRSSERAINFVILASFHARCPCLIPRPPMLAIDGSFRGMHAAAAVGDSLVKSPVALCGGSPRGHTRGLFKFSALFLVSSRKHPSPNGGDWFQAREDSLRELPRRREVLWL